MSLYEKKLAVKKEMKSISKDKENKHLKFKYAQLSAILEELTPVLNTHGLLCDVEVQRLELANPDTKNWVRATLHLILAEDGTSESRCYDFMMDTQQANDVQKSGSTMTYAQRYALSAYWGLAFDDDDPDATHNTPERARPVTTQATAPKPTPASVTPASLTLSLPKVTTIQESSDIFNLAKANGYKTEEEQKALLSEFGLSSFRNIPLDKAEKLKTKLETKFP